MTRSLLARPNHVLQDPPLARLLFSNKYAAWLWLIVRVYVGYQWLEAGLNKITNPAWVGGGTALKGYWTRAIAIPEQGQPPIAFEWYRAFLATMLNQEAYTWFAPFVAYGELLVGIGLIVGAFTGLAAFFGAFMNWNYIMAGSASSNGLLLVLGILLVLAWKVAGYIGLDYYLLPRLSPWKSEGKPDAATPTLNPVPEVGTQRLTSGD